MLRTVADAAPPVRLRPDLFTRARRVRRRRRLLLGAAVPATAVAAAIAVVAASVPAADPSPAPIGAPHASTPGPTTGSVLDSAAAPAVLRLAASHVEAIAPVAIGARQYVYTRSRTQVADGIERHETWAEPQGMITVRIRIVRPNGEAENFPSGNPRDSTLREAAHDRAELRGRGPSLRLPTPRWLAGLPTDGAALLRYFRDRNPADPKRTQDQRVFEEIQRFLRYASPIMPPRLRAGLYRALALMPGVVRVPGQVDLAGRRGIGVGYDDLTIRNEIILDPRTFAVIGQREVEITTGEVVGLSTVDFAIVDEAGRKP
jgi:hypothetical protein